MNNDNNAKMEKLIQVFKEYARENGFILNPDRKVAEGIVKILLEREKNLGAKYCPCRRVTGDKEEDKKIICPCIYHRDEIKKDGLCHCGLFFKNNY